MFRWVSTSYVVVTGVTYDYLIEFSCPSCGNDLTMELGQVDDPFEALCVECGVNISCQLKLHQDW